MFGERGLEPVNVDDTEDSWPMPATTQPCVLSDPAEVTFTPDGVHLWWVSLDRPPLPHESLWGALSQDERERACRFRFQRDQRRYAASRGLLRYILASCLHEDPTSLKFQYTRFGKPSLRQHVGLTFNLSHSRDQLLVGVTFGRDIGVDIEHLKSMTDLDMIARRYFAPSEVARLEPLPQHAKVRAFFECWTRKEAFIKAIGEGLSVPLDSFEVAFGPTAQPRLVAVRGSKRIAREWSLWGPASNPEIVAAVAVKGHGLTLRPIWWAEPARMALSPSIAADLPPA